MNQAASPVRDIKYYKDTWQQISKDLLNHYGETLHRSWFSKLRFVELSGNNLILSAPNSFVKDWVKANYHDTLLSLWTHYADTIKDLDLVTVQEDESDAAGLRTKLEGDAKTGGEPSANSLDENSSYLDSRFIFDNFVVGPSNQLAHAAALAVAESVAESRSAVAESNPLFLYGGVGLGKTHLMHAIAWYVKTADPARKVIYMSAEKFMYQFVKALRNKDIMSFKDEFRSVDILMIDDIQFICGKESTQEEFFHTFNALIDNNRQMVISCDRSPSDLDNIEDRIKSRLGWGLVADVHSTTYELRLGILQSKIELMQIVVPKSVLEFLAAKITSNVRELEGALNKVIAHSTLIGREITVESTQDILRDLLRSNERIITIEDIQKRVADRYNIKKSDMSSSRRCRDVARPRQIAMYLAKQLTSKSLLEIGSKFGKKDHTTVIHAVKKIDSLLATDPEIKEEVDLLMRILQN